VLLSNEVAEYQAIHVDIKGVLLTFQKDAVNSAPDGRYSLLYSWLSVDGATFDWT